MIKNPLLQQAFQKVESSVDDKDSFGKLVSAATKAIYSKDVFTKLTHNLPQSKDPVSDTVHGVFTVMKLLADKAKGTIPPGVFVQAGMALLLDALDFLEQAGQIKIDKETLATAAKEYMDVALNAVGVNQNRLQTILATVKQTASDPQKMAQFQKAVEAS
jgi:hypothetical protein